MPPKNYEQPDFADFLTGTDRVTQSEQASDGSEDSVNSHSNVSGQETPRASHLKPAAGFFRSLFGNTSHSSDPETQEDTTSPEQSQKDAEVLAVSKAIDTGSIDRSEVIGYSLRWFSGWCVRFMVTAFALAILCYIIGKLWTGILPVILSIIVCTVLWPTVRWLNNHGVHKTLAVFLTMLFYIGGFITLFILMAPNVVTQSKALADSAVTGLRTIQQWLQNLGLPIQEDQINGLLDNMMSTIQEQSGRIASEVVNGISLASSMVVTLFMILILTFFFLRDGNKVIPFTMRYSGKRVGFYLSDLLMKCWNTLSGFMNAQAKVSAVDALGIGLGLWILQIPMALALTIITFFAGFIPIVGAVTAGALAVLVALVSKGFTTALIVLAIVLVVQQLESNILSPLLQSKAMNLHPVIVLLSVAIGGALFGIIGAFLAVPTAAMIAVIFRYVNGLIDKVTEDYPDFTELKNPEATILVETANDPEAQQNIEDTLDSFMEEDGDHTSGATSDARDKDAEENSTSSPNEAHQ